MRKDTGTTCGIPCISYSFLYGKEKNMKWSGEKRIYRGRLEMAREGILHVVPKSFRILTATHKSVALSRNILCRSYAHLTPAIPTRGPCQALCAPAPPGLAPPGLARVVLNNRCSSAHVCLHCYTEHLHWRHMCADHRIRRGAPWRLFLGVSTVLQPTDIVRLSVSHTKTGSGVDPSLLY